MLNLAQLNICGVVCVPVLQRGQRGDGCLSASILFRYKFMMRHLFVRSWARVRRGAQGSVLSV